MIDQVSTTDPPLFDAVTEITLRPISSQEKLTEFTRPAICSTSFQVGKTIGLLSPIMIKAGIVKRLDYQGFPCILPHPLYSDFLIIERKWTTMGCQKILIDDQLYTSILRGKEEMNYRCLTKSLGSISPHGVEYSPYIYR
jgi:hypothetical protein